LDWDHIAKAHEFFHLEHAQIYQTGKRYKIKVLWVPSAAITETGCTDEDRIWRAEARHRLREGKGIRVFGAPDSLKKWIEDEGLDYESRKHLITDAGSVIPGFTLAADSTEFFLHSPHAHVMNQRDSEDRNKDCVVMQGTFRVQSKDTRVIFAADAHWETMVDIVTITQKHGNGQRLEYEFFKLPHHCSAYSLSETKGAYKTDPEPKIKEWFGLGSLYCTLISTSDVIPSSDTTQPPHIQAKRYYEDVKADKRGDFKVTMEHPTAYFDPEPLVVEIGPYGGTIKPIASGVGAAAVTSVKPPKAG
jgi:hypothetical protein